MFSKLFVIKIVKMLAGLRCSIFFKAKNIAFVQFFKWQMPEHVPDDEYRKKKI